jgi:hypothetical protein
MRDTLAKLIRSGVENGKMYGRTGRCVSRIWCELSHVPSHERLHV